MKQRATVVRKMMTAFLAPLSNDKLLQVADLICAVRLRELCLLRGLPLNLAESRFFGGAQDFRRNVLKKIKAKEL